MKRQHCYANLERVVLEHRAAKFAIDQLTGKFSTGDSRIIPRNMPFTPRNLRECSQKLEVTYLLRLFSTFEGILRNYWAARRRKLTGISAEILINSVGNRNRMAQKLLDEVHEVRKQRNLIVHHDLPSAPINIDECKSRIARFVSFLPLKW